MHFANCSYLGLEKHPLLIKEAGEALEKIWHPKFNFKGHAFLPFI